jgi:WD40 repeat protein/serine/threonine protein kinase
MVPEQNLLTGIFAIQLKFVSPPELIAAGSKWAVDQDQDICTILLEQGTITTRQADLLRQLTEQQIQSHGGDASAALQTFGGDSAVQKSFAASIIYDRETGVRHRPIGGDTPAPVEGTERNLSDPDQLITEHPGRYTIRGEQGRGGVGRVLIAYDEHIGREIALKELLPDSAASRLPSVGSTLRKSATITARFLREARITGQLEHPGIVPVYELGQREDGNTYYTMKLVRGDTLADRLKKCRNIGERLKLLPHFLDLCQAIAYAHSRGVIHRDIKPGNVMIGEFGETVLLDWGLAKVKGQKDEGAQKLADEIKLLKQAGASETVAGMPIGTPSYMSPEQADGRIEDIDERSDVWCLGAVLYEILTGNPPYTGSTALEVTGKVRSSDVEPVLELQRDAPNELAAVAMNCLKKDRTKRYRRVAEIADDVTAFQTGGMVSAYRYSAGLILRRWVKQHWAGISAAAVVFMVIVVALIVVVGQNAVLERQKATLLAKTLATSAIDLSEFPTAPYQVGMLLALQSKNYELEQTGKISTTTSSALRAQLVDFPLNAVRLTGHEGNLPRVTFSPDGELLASSSMDGTVRVWQSGNLAAEPQVLRGHEHGVNYIAFSPDGKLLASAGGNKDRTVRVWQADNLGATPQVLRGHEASVQHVFFGPNGKLLASASLDKTVRVWQVSDLAAEPRVLRGHEAGVRRVAFSPNGRLLASAGLDHTVRVWQVDNPATEPWVLRGHEAGVDHVAFSPDGRLLASASGDNTVRVWQVDNPATEPWVLRGHEAGVSQVAFSPDGRLLASSSMDTTVRVWQVGSFAAEPQVLRGHTSGVLHLAFSPDGRLLASACNDHTIRIWQVDSLAAEPQKIRGNEDRSLHVAFSPDSRLLASACEDQIVRVWQVDSLITEPQALRGHTSGVLHLAFSPDGRLLASACNDHTIRIWQVDSLAAEPQ